MRNGALLLFAKEPAPGHVKTRLVPRVDHERAARLYEAFVTDMTRRLRTDGRFDLAILSDPEPAASPRLSEIASAAGVPILAQHGIDLGERLARAIADALALARPFAIAVGADHPTLPKALLHLVADHLEAGGEAAIVPSADGGYCALGVARARPEIFAGVPWGGPEVLARTLAAFERAGVEPLLTPAWYDIDGPDDLERLRRELATLDPRSGDFPATTSEALRAIRASPELESADGVTPRVRSLSRPKGVSP